MPVNVHPVFTKIVYEVIVTKLVKLCPLSWCMLLTGFISKDLFRRMKIHCVSNDITIREFLESAISEYLPE